MKQKLNYKDNSKQKIEEERYETIRTLFTISFVLTDSILIFDLVINVVERELESFLYFRFFIALFGLYGTLILIGGYYLEEYCDCDCTCNCSTICNSLFSLCGCSLLFGGLLLIISYCIQLCSIRFYFNNKDKITESLVINMIYALFISSTITIILLIFMIINRKNEKRIKQKID